MSECCAAGSLFDPVKRGQRRRLDLWLKQCQKRLLLCLRKARLDGLKEAPIHQRANASGHTIQRGKGWEFASLFHQRLCGCADEIRRVLHSPGGFLDGLGGDMPNVLALTLNLQMLADGCVIAVERMIGGNIRDQIGLELHDCSNVTNNSSWDGFGLGEIAQTLVGFE